MTEATPSDREAASLIDDIVRDVCELPGDTDPNDPDYVCMTVDELQIILDRNIAAYRVQIEQSALQSSTSAHVPAGYALVPVEPTEAMIAAWGRSHLGNKFTDQQIAAMSDDEAEREAGTLDWRAMLSAAPPLQSPATGEG